MAEYTFPEHLATDAELAAEHARWEQQLAAEEMPADVGRVFSLGQQAIEYAAVVAQTHDTWAQTGEPTFDRVQAYLLGQRARRQLPADLNEISAGVLADWLPPIWANRHQ